MFCGSSVFVLIVLFHSIVLTHTRTHALAIRAIARSRPSPPPRHRSRRLARRVATREQIQHYLGAL
eukprot:4405484-Pleurochrysis_carterae.AAC.1